MEDGHIRSIAQRIEITVANHYVQSWETSSDLFGIANDQVTEILREFEASVRQDLHGAEELKQARNVT